MARQYTQRAFIGGNLANADDWNSEMNSSVSELNGQLDQNNMPLSTVNDSKVADPVLDVEIDTTAVSRYLVAHTYMPSQSYHVSSLVDDDPTDLTFETTTWAPDDWFLGWQRLAQKRLTPNFGTNYYAGAEVQFEAKEGMLVGEILIDASWRQSFREIAPESGIQDKERNDGFIEFGAFCNDVCVARSDLQFLGGRFTFVLPFSTPIGSTNCSVDIRFRLIFINGKEVSPILSEFISSFKVRDSSIFVRNQYR
jgi:hypothetical protein